MINQIPIGDKYCGECPCLGWEADFCQLFEVDLNYVYGDNDDDGVGRCVECRKTKPIIVPSVI